MALVVVTASVSLDGFMAGPDVGVEHAMGVGGERLHEWMAHEPGVVEEAFARTGAAVLGRRTFDVGLQHWDDTPYPVPSFVVTHEVREPLPCKSADFTFVNDGVESAVALAVHAAGDRDVVLMGADVSQQALRAGLVDEIRIQLVPVVLGTGRRLFEHVGPLELGPTPVSHLTFRPTRTR